MFAIKFSVILIIIGIVAVVLSEDGNYMISLNNEEVK